MNILYYFKEKNVLMDQWQRAHIFDELARDGHRVTVFNPLNYGSTDEANDKFVRYIEKNVKEIDLIMTPHGSKDLYKTSHDRLKSLGLPSLLICFDNLVVPFAHKDVADCFDLVWLTSRETKYLFDRWGAKTIVQPYAANPHLLKPIEASEIRKVAFIGSPYGSRVNMIHRLLEGDVEMGLFFNRGQGGTSVTGKKRLPNVKVKDAINLMKFPIGRRIIHGAVKQKSLKMPSLNLERDNVQVQAPIGLEELGEAYARYALSLASTAARNTGVLKKPVNIVNLRSFEIPMSGGLQLCAYFDELAEYFEADKEIVFYHSDEELVEKAAFYLKPENDALRRKMKEAARRRAASDHTWAIRFNAVFERMGLK